MSEGQFEEEMARANACNAFVHVFNDPKPAKPGPLNDLRISVKDNISLAGLPTTGASPVFASLELPENKAIAALREAGAVIVGKTNLHELAFGITGANSHTGDTLNPVNTAYLPGGSSAGAAASVAAGACDVGVGTDTGGSCRIPAAHCGIVGYRPTIGRYDGSSVLTLSRTRDTLGLLAKDMASLARVDAVMAGKEGASEPLAATDISIGLVPPAAFLPVQDADMMAVYDKAIDRLRAAGCAITDADLSAAMKIHEDCGFQIAVYESAKAMGSLAQETLGLSFGDFIEQIASPDVQGMFAMQVDDAAVPAPVYDKAMGEHLPALRAAFVDAFAKAQADVLVYPCVLAPPVKVGSGDMMTVAGQDIPVFQATTATTMADSTAGQPSITLPCGMANGLPVGLMLVAPIGGDDTLIQIAASLETSVGDSA